ncbi:hypothetical protein ABH908_000380 [Pseudomonas frederiksbergensis]|uniref:hypothetical protein n=1 Tax=Pseudomonas TaxID=286 RepID=UPI003D1A80D2
MNTTPNTNTVATVFNRATAQGAIDALKAALGAIDIGFKIETGNGSFNQNEVTLQIKVRIPGGKDPARVQLEQMCTVYGFDPDVSLNCRSLGSFKLVEFHPRRPKYPWAVMTADGTKYKMDHESVEAAVARQRKN